MTRIRRVTRLAPLAFALALLAPAAARAEIIDFDPADEAPEILEADELALLDGLGGVEYPFALTDPSPDGRRIVVIAGDAPTIVDLGTGEETEIDGGDADGFDAFGPYVWVDETTLGQIAQTVEQESEDEPPVVTYYRTTVDATTGEATTETLDALADLGGSLVGFSPDLDQLVVLLAAEGGSFLPRTREVTVGIPDELERPGVPLPEGVERLDDLPGAVGTMPHGALTALQDATRVVLVGAGDGAAADLVELPAETALAGISWRPDGERLVVATMRVMDWDGDRERDNEPSNAPREPNLDDPSVQEALGLLTPAENPLLRDTRARVFDTASAEEVHALAGADFPQGTFAGFEWSPSGTHALLTLALRSDLDGRSNPVYAFPSGLERRVLDGETLADQGVLGGATMDSLGARIAFVDDDTLIAALPEGVDTRLARVDLAAGGATTVWERPGAMWQVVAGGGRVVFAHTSVDEPLELWSADAADVEGSAAALTELNAAVAENSHLAAHAVSWTTRGGERLSGIVVTHEDAGFPPVEPGPLVVWQQGGPGGQMTSDFGTSVEGPYSVLPHFGIPVLIANAAGRTVGERAFFSAMADGTSFGQLDIDQIKDGVDALVARGIVDPERVGITGCSYGGYFTLQSLRRYPDVYAAANAQCSLTDLFEEFTYGYAPFVSYLMGRAPMADPAEYLADSPLYGSKDVTTPTLLFHGREDFLPFQLINNYHDQLELSGTEVQFLRVAGEGHGFGMDASQRYAAQLQIEWFREHLGVPDDWEPDPRVREESVRVFLPSTVHTAALVETTP